MAMLEPGQGFRIHPGHYRDTLQRNQRAESNRGAGKNEAAVRAHGGFFNQEGMRPPMHIALGESARRHGGLASTAPLLSAALGSGEVDGPDAACPHARKIFGKAPNVFIADLRQVAVGCSGRSQSIFPDRMNRSAQTCNRVLKCRRNLHCDVRGKPLSGSASNCWSLFGKALSAE
jgi:hypothetical protein